MSRTKTLLKEDTKSMSTPVYGHVKQMVRQIAQKQPDRAKGIDSVYEVDQELEMWYQQGYELFATHFLGLTPESFDVMYILVYKGQPIE